jgi:hypothetical protein
MQVKTRLLRGDIWSALNEATFRLVEGDSPLRITEIMYNPAEGGDYEFIELQNGGEEAVNLAGMSLEGIDFTFLPTTPVLAPGEFMVLVRDPAAFTAKYPDVPSGGVYQGQLSNKGETITLKDAQGEVITSVSYDDEQGWPLSPDGRGDSLTLSNPDGDPNNPKSWRASQNLNGSPGAAEPTRPSLHF